MHPRLCHVRKERLAFALNFLGGHVIRCAFRNCGGFRLGLSVTGQAEIDQFGFVVGVEKNVAWFDIAVQEVVLEGEVESRSDLDSDIQHLKFIQPLVTVDALIQAAAIGQLHYQVALTVKIIEGIDVNDIRMIEGSAGPRLADEAFQSDGIVLQFLPHQFHGHHPLQHGVVSAIDFSMPAGGNFAAQFELPHLHRHHQRMPTALAWLGRKRGKVSLDESFGITSRACHHLERLIDSTHALKVAKEGVRHKRSHYR